MNLTRFKRLWQLANKDPESLKRLDKLTDDQLDALPDANDGDGKAVFFELPDQKAFEEFQREEKGMKGIAGL